MRKLILLSPLLFVVALVPAQTRKPASSKGSLSPVVKVEGGRVEGYRDGSGLLIFKGIPFAAPPVGALRWKAPQPVIPWQGIRKCTAFGPSPMQPAPAPFYMWSSEFLIPKAPISEDCLYLNVWTGAHASKDKRPVLVWIYGGGFSSGGSGVPIYDGAAYAKRGVVFVSINYRVGIFGFLALPELDRESPDHVSGNYGLLDQIAALRWVKKNITAFGGDPDNVTIAGQSAGSMSVNCLVASPLARGLFNKAIAESGANFTGGGFGIPSLQDKEKAQENIESHLKASSLADLREISADSLLKVGGGWGPNIDGYVLPEPIARIFEQGRENKVPLLTGWNQGEGLLFGPVATEQAFRKMATAYGADSTAFLKFYPAGSDSQAAASQLDLQRDKIFGVQNYTWANLESSQGIPVYVYRFTHKVPGTGVYAKFGAFHTGEVPYAYGNLKFSDRPFKPVDYALEKTMSSYWINFIKSGDPNEKGLPDWPLYKSGTQKIMQLGDVSHAETIPDRARLDFLRNLMNSGK
ncbi:MAG: carboxylesterase family protein [Bacteroidota bacterium]|nr:carboxylesterase family protein [Bacteroidota bacterium]